jgi:hypothetical protein
MRQTNNNGRATRGASACAARAIPQINNQQSDSGFAAQIMFKIVYRFSPPGCYQFYE